MKKMLISLVIEGDNEKELNEAKTTIISACAGQLISVTTNIMDESKKEIEVFQPSRHYGINSLIREQIERTHF